MDVFSKFPNSKWSPIRVAEWLFQEWAEGRLTAEPWLYKERAMAHARTSQFKDALPSQEDLNRALLALRAQSIAAKEKHDSLFGKTASRAELSRTSGLRPGQSPYLRGPGPNSGGLQLSRTWSGSTVDLNPSYSDGTPSSSDARDEEFLRQTSRGSNVPLFDTKSSSRRNNPDPFAREVQRSFQSKFTYRTSPVQIDQQERSQGPLGVSNLPSGQQGPGWPFRQNIGSPFLFDPGVWTMPSGKYEGVPLKDLPNDYIDRVLVNREFRDPFFNRVVGDFLRRRGKQVIRGGRYIGHVDDVYGDHGALSGPDLDRFYDDRDPHSRYRTGVSKFDRARDGFGVSDSFDLHTKIKKWQFLGGLGAPGGAAPYTLDQVRRSHQQQFIERGPYGQVYFRFGYRDKEEEITLYGPRRRRGEFRYPKQHDPDYFFSRDVGDMNRVIFGYSGAADFDPFTGELRRGYKQDHYYKPLPGGGLERVDAEVRRGPARPPVPIWFKNAFKGAVNDVFGSGFYQEIFGSHLEHQDPNDPYAKGISSRRRDPEPQWYFHKESKEWRSRPQDDYAAARQFFNDMLYGSEYRGIRGAWQRFGGGEDLVRHAQNFLAFQRFEAREKRLKFREFDPEVAYTTQMLQLGFSEDQIRKALAKRGPDEKLTPLLASEEDRSRIPTMLKYAHSLVEKGWTRREVIRELRGRQVAEENREKRAHLSRGLKDVTDLRLLALHELRGQYPSIPMFLKPLRRASAPPLPAAPISSGLSGMQLGINSTLGATTREITLEWGPLRFGKEAYNRTHVDERRALREQYQNILDRLRMEHEPNVPIPRESVGRQPPVLDQALGGRAPQTVEAYEMARYTSETFGGQHEGVNKGEAEQIGLHQQEVTFEEWAERDASIAGYFRNVKNEAGVERVLQRLEKKFRRDPDVLDEVRQEANLKLVMLGVLKG